MITFYGYKRCGTSRKAEKFLEEKGMEYNFIDITVNPPSFDDLKSYVKKSGEPLKKFFNTSGVQYKELNMKDKVKELTDDELMVLLASNGKLIKRPVVTDGEKITIGFKDDIFASVWR